MSIAYIENDPYPAQWLQNLAAAGHLPTGEVLCEDIRAINPSSLKQYHHVHAFAGIGGWPHALRIAGWPDAVRTWTGSCPCQPFSRAGRRQGVDDERHLWPVWFKQIRECTPPVVFGEQVSGKDGLAWIDTVSADLESIGYAIAAADMCAASVGAPHVRQRLFFGAIRMVDADQLRLQGELPTTGSKARRQAQCPGDMGDERLVNAVHPRPEHSIASVGHVEADRSQRGFRVQTPLLTGEHRPRLDDPDGIRCQRRWSASRPAGEHAPGWTGKAEWVPLRDGTIRPTKPGVRVVAHGVPARVAKLRAFGNAIVPQVAAQFVRSFMDAIQDFSEVAA